MSDTAFKRVGTPVWCFLETSEVGPAIDFYTQLFGWTYDREQGVFLLNGKLTAGIVEAPDGGTAAWRVSLSTPDATATAEAIGAAGGTVTSGPTELEAAGVLVSAVDIAGALVSFWEADGREGFGVTHEAGAPEWFENWTLDYAAAVPFYEAAAGWTPTPNGPAYTLNGPYTESSAAIRDVRAAEPSATLAWEAEIVASGRSTWIVDFSADGSDGFEAFAARVTALGGSVPHPAGSDPHVRTALRVVDPTAASFGVLDSTYMPDWLANGEEPPLA
jgi:uncharacterized protein